MKRNIVTLLITGISVFFATGCEGLLDTEPKNRYTADSFWSTEIQADAGLTACYQTLRKSGIYGGDATPLWEDTGTPNATDYNSGSGFFRIAEGTHNASNTGIINDRWRHAYEGIGRCNTSKAPVML